MPSDDLEITEDELPDGARRVALRGELDMVTAPPVRERLTELIGSGAAVRLDLREVEFMDSTGIGVLLATTKAAEEADATFEIVRPRGEPWRVVQLTALDNALPFVDDQND